MQNLITNCPTTNKWYSFISNPEYIAYCEQKNIQIWFKDLVLIKKQRATTYEPIPDFFNEE